MQKMIGVIASFMDSQARWDYFCQMLDSINDQTRPLDYLLVGMSFCNREAAHQYISLLMKRAKPKGFVLVTSMTPLSQGEMWKKMLDKHSDRFDAASWIVFSDDDDLWHPRRTELYSLTLNAAGISGVLPKISGIHAPYVHDEQPFKNGQSPVTHQDVNTLIKAGVLLMKPFVQGTQNYVDTCCRAMVFKEIMLATNAFLRRHPHFDTILQQAICQYRPDVFFSIPMVPESLVSFGAQDVWMYYWRNSAESATTKMKKHPFSMSFVHYVTCAREVAFRSYMRDFPAESKCLRKVGQEFKKQLPYNYDKYFNFSYL